MVVDGSFLLAARCGPMALNARIAGWFQAPAAFVDNPGKVVKAFIR
jgi:hypothetical protein